MTTQANFATALLLLALTAAPGASPASEGGTGPATEDGAAAITPADFTDRQVWGGADNVVGVKHLYLSAQPDRETFAAAVDHGVGVVINLRDPAEQDWDEEAAAADAGLTYYNVPISRSGPGFDDGVLENLSRLVGEHRDTKILMHCSTGNRAAAWFAFHLARDHGMPVEQSIDLSHRAGLTNAGMEARIREYLVPGRGDGDEE